MNKKTTRRNEKVKATVIIAIVLGVLVLVSVVQAFQLNSLKQDLKDGQVNVGKATSKVSAASAPSSSPAVPSSLQNLPDMVGGC